MSRSPGFRKAKIFYQSISHPLVCLVVICFKPLPAAFGDEALFVCVHQHMLPSIRLVVTMAVICGSLLLSYFKATVFHRKHEGNMCTPHLGESLIKRWNERVYETLISGTSL